MQFILSDLVYENYINLNTYVILKKDSWNDWFAYKTLFSVYFCEKESEPKWLGNIKIGFLNNDYLSEEIGTNTYYSPNLPNEFTSLLNTNFYSLGQDSTYYESLNNLPEDIRIEILKSLNDISYNLVLFKQGVLSEKCGFTTIRICTFLFIKADNTEVVKMLLNGCYD